MIILNEGRKTQIPYAITYTWNLKYDTNEPIYETETNLRDTENRLLVAKGRWVGEGCIGSLGLGEANWHI